MCLFEGLEQFCAKCLSPRMCVCVCRERGQCIAAASPLSFSVQYSRKRAVFTPQRAFWPLVSPPRGSSVSERGCLPSWLIVKTWASQDSVLLCGPSGLSVCDDWTGLSVFPGLPRSDCDLVYGVFFSRTDGIFVVFCGETYDHVRWRKCYESSFCRTPVPAG